MKRVLAFLLYLLSIQFSSHSCPFQAAIAKVAVLRRTIVNKQTKHIPEKCFWGHLYGFFGLVTAVSLKPSQGGAFSHREEPVAWSAQAEGGTGGVERFGGGKGKAHLLYSWPLCVKQALWAVTELERRASERPLALL